MGRDPHVTNETGGECSFHVVRRGHRIQLLSNVVCKPHEFWSEFRELLRRLDRRCAAAIEDQHGPRGSVIEGNADHVDSRNQHSDSDKEAFLVNFGCRFFNAQRDVSPFTWSRLTPYMLEKGFPPFKRQPRDGRKPHDAERYRYTVSYALRSRSAHGFAKS
jgi:hypothetical protein